MPHQWMEGNLQVSAKCMVCDKTCGSVLRLQDWRCLWCRSTVHTACRPQAQVACPMGPLRVSIVPPTSLHSIGIDDAWDVCKPNCSFSPLLVLVNSKSGENKGNNFLKRFKQLLNPAQVFDIMNNGPGIGLRLFRHFDPFRILICSGDGSVGWVLREIDHLNMHVSRLPQIQLKRSKDSIKSTGNANVRRIGWIKFSNVNLFKIFESIIPIESRRNSILARLKPNRLFTKHFPLSSCICYGCSMSILLKHIPQSVVTYCKPQ